MAAVLAPPAAPRPGSTRRQRRRQARLEAWLAPVVAVVAVVVAHLWLVGHMRAPIVQADEYGYLYGAHFLALGGPTPATAGYPASPYYPGYSLLLAPLWWLSTRTATVYHWALLVNVALAAVTAVLAYVLAGCLAPELGGRWRALVCLVVSAYPAFLLFGNMAESENLLVPAFLAVCLLAARAFSCRSGERWWAALGLAAGLLYAVHPSALAVAVSVALVGGWVALRGAGRRGPGRLLVALGAGLVLGLGASQALIAYVTSGGPSAGRGLLATVGREVAPAGLAHLGVTLAGQSLYLLAGSAGLVVLGAAMVAAALRDRVGDTAGAGLGAPASRGARGWGPGRGGAAAGVPVLIGVTAVAMLVLSALSVGQGPRLDSVIYGRYDEGVLAPLLVLGALGGLRLQARGRRPRSLAVVGGGLVALGATAAGVVAGRGRLLHGVVQATNVLAAHALFRPMHPSLDVVALAGLGAGALVVSVLAWRARPVLGAVVAVALFVPSTAASLADLARQSRGTAAQQVVPDALVALRSQWGARAGCVAWDVAVNVPFDFFNDRLFDPAQRFAPFDSRTGGRPCSDEVISGLRHLEAVLAGAREVVPGNGVPQALWVRPGPLQDRLRAAGWLVPAGGPGPLPAGARRAQVRLAEGQPAALTLAPGDHADVRIALTHPAGPDNAPWLNLAGLGRPGWSVRVRASWEPAAVPGAAVPGAAVPGARPSAAGSVADLPSSLLPGQSEDVTVVVTAARAGGSPLAPGQYVVRLSLVQQGGGLLVGGPAPVAILRVTVAG